MRADSTRQFESWGGQFYSAKRFSDAAALSLGGHYQESRGPDLTKYYPAELRLGDLTVGDPPVVVVPAAARSYDSATRSLSSFAKVELWDGLSFGLNQSLFVAPTSAGALPNLANFDAAARNHTLLLTTYAKYEFDAGTSASGQVQVNYSHEQLPESKFNNGISGFADAYKYGLGERYQVEANVRYELDKHTFTAGANAELYYSLPHTTDLSTPYDPDKSPGEQTFFYPGSAGTLPVRFFEANYSNVGGFLQVQSEWTDKFSTTAGARFDYNQDYYGTLNPRAGIVYKASDNTTLKALYGRSFRRHRHS